MGYITFMSARTINCNGAHVAEEQSNTITGTLMSEPFCVHHIEREGPINILIKYFLKSRYLRKCKDDCPLGFGCSKRQTNFSSSCKDDVSDGGGQRRGDEVV